MRWKRCFRVCYPSWRSGIFPWQKMTWRMARAEATGCRCPAGLQWNASAATLCPPPGWPAEMTGCICKTAQLRRLSTSQGPGPSPDKRAEERSLLFRLNNVLNQIKSNYDCLVLPDDFTPSVWISQGKKREFWTENYAFVRYGWKS